MTQKELQAIKDLHAALDPLPPSTPENQEQEEQQTIKECAESVINERIHAIETDIEAKPQSICTPMELKTLLAAGVSPNETYGQNIGPLFCYLLSMYIDANTKNYPSKDFSTDMHVMLDEGAEVNGLYYIVIDNEQHTILYILVESYLNQGHEVVDHKIKRDIFKELIHRVLNIGADVNIHSVVDEDEPELKNQTVLDLAIEHDAENLAKFLRKRGAKTMKDIETERYLKTKNTQEKSQNNGEQGQGYGIS